MRLYPEGRCQVVCQRCGMTLLRAHGKTEVYPVGPRVVDEELHDLALEAAATAVDQGKESGRR